MHIIEMPTLPDYATWRAAAKAALAKNIPPHQILWQTADMTAPDLFAATPPAEGSHPGNASDASADNTTITVPKDFIELAKAAIDHRSEDKHALLYRLLWRLNHENPHLLKFTTDRDVITLQKRVREVRRDSYKITAFLRFREITKGDDVSRFIAWYEPAHFTLKRTLPFFTTRFKNMRWSILTPEQAAHYDGSRLTLEDNPDPAHRPTEDRLEKYWLRYYASTFNPARPKKSAMLREMPMKYWKNMPETALIPGLLQGADQRARDMIARSKTNTDLKKED